MTEFDVEAVCPACGARFAVPRIRAGSTERCPVCRFGVRVPGVASEEASSAPPVPAQPGTERMDGMDGMDRDGAAPAGAAGPYSPSSSIAPPPPPAERQRTGTCCVCMQDDERFNPLAAAKAILELSGRSELETKMQVTRGQGLLATGVPEDVVPVMLERLGAAGLRAFAVDEGLVPEVGRVLPVVRLHDVDPTALRFQTDVRGGVHAMPTAAIAAGFCSVKHVVQGGPPELDVSYDMGYRGQPRTVIHTKPRENPVIVCTLLTAGRSGAAYQVGFSELEVRYEYLGPRLLMNAARNFVLTLGDLIAHCRSAFFPSSIRALAAGNRLRAVQIGEKTDYQRYLKWILCCVGHRWHGGPIAQ